MEWFNELIKDDGTMKVPKPAVPKVRKSIIQRHCNTDHNIVTSTPIKQNEVSRRSGNVNTPFAKYRLEDRNGDTPRSPSPGVAKRQSAKPTSSRRHSFGITKETLDCVIGSFRYRNEGSLGTPQKIVPDAAEISNKCVCRLSFESERNINNIPEESKIENVVQNGVNGGKPSTSRQSRSQNKIVNNENICVLMNGNESDSDSESNNLGLIRKKIDKKGQQTNHKIIKSNLQDKSNKIVEERSKSHQTRNKRKLDDIFKVYKPPPIRYSTSSSSDEDLEDESERNVKKSPEIKNSKRTHYDCKWRESKGTSKISKYVRSSSSDDLDDIDLKKIKKYHHARHGRRIRNKLRVQKSKSKRSKRYSISSSDYGEDNGDTYYKSKLKQPKCNSKIKKLRLKNNTSLLHEKITRSERITSSSDDNLDEVDKSKKDKSKQSDARKEYHNPLPDDRNNVNRENGVHKNLTKTADKSNQCNTCISRKKNITTQTLFNGFSADEIIDTKTAAIEKKKMKIKEYEGPKQRKQFCANKSIQTKSFNDHTILFPTGNNTSKSSPQMKTTNNLREVTKKQCLFDESLSAIDIIEDTSESVGKVVHSKVQVLLEEWPSSDADINQMAEEKGANLPTPRNNGLQRNLEGYSTQRKHSKRKESKEKTIEKESRYIDNEKSVTPMPANIRPTPQDSNKKSTTSSENVRIHNVVVLMPSNTRKPESDTEDSDKQLVKEIISNEKRRISNSRQNMTRSRDFDEGQAEIERTSHTVNGSKTLSRNDVEDSNKEPLRRKIVTHSGKVCNKYHTVAQNRDDNYKGQNEIASIVVDKTNVYDKFEGAQKAKFVDSCNNSMPKQSVLGNDRIRGKNAEDTYPFASAQTESLKRDVDKSKNHSAIVDMHIDVRDPNEVHSSSSNKESMRTKDDDVGNNMVNDDLLKRRVYVLLKRSSDIKRILCSEENTTKSKDSDATTDVQVNDDVIFAKPLPKRNITRKARSRNILETVVNQEESLSTTQTVRRSGRQRKPATFTQLIVEANEKYLCKLAKESDNCTLTSELKSYKDMQNSSKQLRTRSRNVTVSNKENLTSDSLEATVSKRKPRAKGKASSKETTPAVETTMRGSRRKQTLTETCPTDEETALSTVQEEEACTSKKTSTRGKKKPTTTQGKEDTGVVAPDFEPPPVMEEIYVHLTPTVSVQIDDNHPAQELSKTNLTTKRKLSCDETVGSNFEEQPIDKVKSVECFKRTQQYIETHDECVKTAVGLKYSCSQAGRLRISGNGKKSKQTLRKTFMHLTVLTGRCKVLIEEACEVLEAGQDAIVPMGATYSIQNDDPNETLEVYCVRFRSEET